MAKKKYQFKPDKLTSGILDKLYMTKQMRIKLLKWVLFSLMLLVASLLQDVIFCHMNIFGATTDLVPCAIFLICMVLGTERSCIFALVASAMYQFSGTGPGYQAVATITILCLLGAMFRQSYLRRDFFSCLLCAGVLTMAYELIIFFFAILLGQTHFSRVLVAVFTGVLTLFAIPVYYPIANAIDKIGGEIWRD
jgi:rod shape-determining protein MreD